MTKHNALSALFTFTFFAFLTISYVTVNGAFAAASFKLPIQQSTARRPPRIPQNPLLPAVLFTDQSDYVRLGDNIGTVLALGDFTADRYVDLLVVQNAQRLRSVAVLSWNHLSYSFRMPLHDKNSSFSAMFSLNSISAMSSDATIASATTFDANSDGFLDVLLSIRLEENRYVAAILHGNGSGCLKFDHLIPDVHPYALIMDANDDMLYDIFFTNSIGERIFYVNGPPGKFTKHVWKPWTNSAKCIPTYPFNSNSFVDVNGDCAPDLVITSSCGMEVWLNNPPNQSSSKGWRTGHHYSKKSRSFHRLTMPKDKDHFMILNQSVWSEKEGDGHAVFSDFNADGAIDIAVINTKHRTVRISYYVRRPRFKRKLCSVDPNARFDTHLTLTDVAPSETDVGSTTVQPMLRVGDFNFDGLSDILLLDADSGTIGLYVAAVVPEKGVWFDPGSWHLSSVLDRFLFPITGGWASENAVPYLDIVKFIRYDESPLLNHLEDPIAATFFDVDESGRQDILISQRHGTRLIWNNYQNLDDAVYFKATGVNAAQTSPTSQSYSQPFSPLPGNTFKVSYGGRHRRETHVCTQCPQSTVLALQSCSCFFGITRIANYIEEMAMGGASGVRTWIALMPNALAIVWPQRFEPGTSVKWKVSYLSKGRDGQMKKIVLVLCVTLAILLFAIVYIHSLERREPGGGKFHLGYT